jgi:rhodanese-related sulfurtransferase|tara:strand:- start:209 stop:523 length:315 start_codon:yes stop_codon:yes gene_type:complete
MINLECKDWIKNISSYKKSIILDVRTVEEYEEISIPNAILANILEPNEFMDVVEKLEKKTKIFVYCRSGIRSQKACNILDQLGFKETYNLNGGILEWKKTLTND